MATLIRHFYETEYVKLRKHRIIRFLYLLLQGVWAAFDMTKIYMMNNEHVETAEKSLYPT